MVRSRFATMAAIALAGLLLAACESVPTKGEYPESRRPGDSGPQYGKRQSVFGSGGLNLFGGDKVKKPAEGGGIGVNSFLWRASLDTIAFMPVNSADPFGGVIITDWHSPGGAERERFKMNVYILGRSLRADGVRVAVFRQVKAEIGRASGRERV